MGPLHGLPISCKVFRPFRLTVVHTSNIWTQDTFRVKGHHATAGYVNNLKEPAVETNSALIDLLLDAGAVLYTKTNVPQTMMVRKTSRLYAFRNLSFQHQNETH